jgi:inosine/xanthosine triphosphate pyrophosphatase family protein
VKKFKKYYDELTENEHQEINHRLKAIKKLIPKIKLIFDKINIK